MKNIPFDLKLLEGSKLTDISHAADMITWFFEDGETEYALHVQCPCRLIHREKVMLTRSSYYDMRDPDDDYNDKDTLFQHLVETVVRPLLPLTVTQVTVTPLSDLCIRFEGDMRLEVFAEHMPCFEQWRFFLGDRDDLPHMVAYGGEIVFEGGSEEDGTPTSQTEENVIH